MVLSNCLNGTYPCRHFFFIVCSPSLPSLQSLPSLVTLARHNIRPSADTLGQKESSKRNIQVQYKYGVIREDEPVGYESRQNSKYESRACVKSFKPSRTSYTDGGHCIPAHPLLVLVLSLTSPKSKVERGGHETLPRNVDIFRNHSGPHCHGYNIPSKHCTSRCMYNGLCVYSYGLQNLFPFCSVETIQVRISHRRPLYTPSTTQY